MTEPEGPSEAPDLAADLGDDHRLLRWSEVGEDSVLHIADERGAFEILRRLRSDPRHIQALRSVLADEPGQYGLHRVDDEEVFRRAAWALHERRLVLTQRAARKIDFPNLPPPPPPPPKPGPAPKKPKEIKRPWSLKVTVFTKAEWRWPKDDVTVEVKGPRGSTQTTQMTSNRSPQTFFKGDHDTLHEYEASASAPGWSAVSSFKILLKNEDDKECEVELAPDPSHVYLRLEYKEPEGTARALPKDLPVVVEFADASTRNLKLGADGLLDFPIEPLKKSQQAPLAWFTLRIEPGNVRIVVNDPKKPDDPDALKSRADADKAAKDGARRAFTLPKKFALKESDWAVEPSAHFDDHKFKDANDPAVVFGSAKAPVKVTLDPHWQYLRIVYGSRWRPKEPARISIPRTFVDAFAVKATEGPDPDIRSNWTTGAAADGKTAVQCVPWILRDTAKPKPDAEILLRFETPADTFVETKDDGSRVVASGTKHDAPVPDRLRFYDLPTLWRSHQYYARLSGGGGADEGDLFEQMAAKPTKLDRALTFCLDDVVLTKDDLAPLPWTAGDRVALFSHLLDDNELDGAAVADLSPEGIHKPDTTAHLSFFSEKQSARNEDDRNYFFRYADWTRLVAYKGNLFDVFDQRVNQTAPDLTKVTGARAGVRWIDTTDVFPGIQAWVINGGAWAAAPDNKPQPKRMLGDASNANAVEKRPGRTDKRFFSMQPYFQQRTSVRYRQRFDPANDEGGGRFDMTLLRCTDVVDVGKPEQRERAVNLHYFRFAFNFIDDPAVAPVAPALPVGSVLPANLPPVTARPKWEDEIIKNVNNRWNGEDAVNAKRTALIPQSAGVKIEIPVVWIAQNLPTEQCHFLVDVHKFTPAARDNRGGMLGTGESSTMSHADRTTNDWFPSAHETGHADSLPDEYNERWDSCSYGAISFNSNVVADPYEPDGRTPTGEAAGSPMMNGNQTMRNRYFWHCAEWARVACTAMGTAAKFKVAYDTYRNYFLPPHAAAGRTFTYWPAGHSLAPNGATAADRSAANCCDVFLNILGEEKWTVTDLPAADQPDAGAKANLPYDGVLTVILKLSCTLADSTWAGPPTAAQIESWNTGAVQALEHACGVLNNRWYVTGDIGAGEQAKTFSRCLIQFSSRLLVLNHPDNAKATGIENVHNRHYKLTWVNDASDFACWGTPGGGADLMAEADWTTLAAAKGLAKPTLDTAVHEYHAIAKPKLTARKDALQTVITEATIAEGADLMTRPQWETFSNVPGATRSATLVVPIDVALDQYHAAKPAGLAARVTAAEALKVLTQKFIDDVGAMSAILHPQFHKRLPMVQTLDASVAAKIVELHQLEAAADIKKSATAAKQYCTDAIPSRQFFVFTETFAVIRSKFEEYILNFFALEKATDELAAADLNAIVARTGIANAQVHRI